MRVLVFCSDLLRQAAYAERIPGARVTGWEPLNERTVRWFHETPDAVLVCGPYYAIGWRAPAGTRVLIDSDFPGGALAAQAAARPALEPREARDA